MQATELLFTCKVVASVPVIPEYMQARSGGREDSRGRPRPFSQVTSVGSWQWRCSLSSRWL